VAGATIAEMPSAKKPLSKDQKLYFLIVAGNSAKVAQPSSILPAYDKIICLPIMHCAIPDRLRIA
ncbi:MAG: hypothetical protein LBJ10_03320, partial [Clostridiales bacterium]|nr:hypothetical protein [Clostridiales bacterium]